MRIKKEWISLFEEFYQQYDSSNPKIKERYLHTYRVVDRIEELAISLHLTEEEIELAELIALLHDIGRFEQLSIYHTVNDRKSLDHGEYGVKILFEDGLIEKFKIPEEYYPIIKISIFNHNKMELTGIKNKKEELFAKMIKDADKLDIIYLLIENNELPTTNEEVTPTCRELFFQHQMIPYRELKTDSDHLLIYLGYVYELYFSNSFRYLEETKLYEKMAKELNYPSHLKEYFQEVEKYIQNKSIEPKFQD